MAVSAMDLGSDFPARRVIWEDNKSYPDEIKICYDVDDDSDRISSDNVVYCLPLLKDAHGDLLHDATSDERRGDAISTNRPTYTVSSLKSIGEEVET